MTSTSDYRLVQDAQKRARKAGFQLAVHDTTFGVVPLKGMSNRLMPLSWSTRYRTLEEALAFCEGWHALERSLQAKAGIGVRELSERMEQHAVLVALKGKGRRKTDGA